MQIRYAVIARLWLAALACGLLFACDEPADPSPPLPGRNEAIAADPVGPIAIQRPTKLVFGVTPYMTEAELRADYGPLVKHLGEALKLPAELVIPATYQDLVALIEKRGIHVAVFSPFNYVRTRRNHPGIEPLVLPIAGGSSSYAAYIVSHRDSPIRTVEDLRAKRFAFVDRRSASGYLYAVAHLRRLGHDPESFFSEVVFAGNHTKLAQMVIAGEVDGAATYAVPTEMKSRGRLRIIAKTGRVPLDVFAATPGLDLATREEVKRTLLELNTRTPEGRSVLQTTSMTGFVVVEDSLYDDVREAEKAAGVAPEQPLERAPEAN